MRPKVVVLVSAIAALCLAPVAASAINVTKKPTKGGTVYYLALGDSLSRGAQPNAAGKTVPGKHGYANDLYAAEKKKIKHLKFKDLGCLGETTASMMNGGMCHYAAGSQLKQALKFIKGHKIKFVTIDMGANDVDKCANGLSVNLPCITAGEASIKTNIPKIAAALRKAGAKLKIIGMTYYDPFLADYLQGTTGKTLATVSVTLDKTVNTDITNGYATKNIKVADVATAFDTYVPFTTTATYNGQTVPEAVARICEWTWMCAPKPKGPNIHANNTGYVQIEKVFKGVNEDIYRTQSGADLMCGSPSVVDEKQLKETHIRVVLPPK